MKAPTSRSLLSKAYDFFRSRTSKDERVFDKPKNTFLSDIYQDMSQPIEAKEMASPSKKNKYALKEVNRANSVSSDHNMKGRTEEYWSRPRTAIKNYWTSWGLKKMNAENKEWMDNKEIQPQQEEEDEDEGVFSIQLIKPQCGYLGIVLVGGADTPFINHYVNDILPGSSASKSGRVRVGDELLEVNGHTIRGTTHAQALTIFRALPTVVTLVVARNRHANRAILKRVQKKESEKVNNNIARPERKRSVIEEAVTTSIIPRSLSSVIDVTKKACPYVKPVKRASRVSSFIGSVEDIVTRDEANGDNSKKSLVNEDNETAGSPRRVDDNRFKDDKAAYTLLDKPGNEDYAVFHGGTTTTDSVSLKSSTPCQSTFDLPQIDEEHTLRYSSVALRRSRTINGSLKRRSVIERCDARSTWPSATTKQRASIAWDSFIPPKQASIRRSSSARFRLPVGQTSAQLASNLSLHQSSSRKTNAKHYIEKKTIVVEIRRESTDADWGFTIGGGICSPYGDLPIFIVGVANDGMAWGLVESGDEVIGVSGDSFDGLTFLEAEKILRNSPKTNVTVTIKRKFLQRTQSPQSNPYAEAWRSPDSPNTAAGRQKKRPKSMQC